MAADGRPYAREMSDREFCVAALPARELESGRKWAGSDSCTFSDRGNSFALCARELRYYTTITLSHRFGCYAQGGKANGCQKGA
jgi:hypothetical protein